MRIRRWKRPPLRWPSAVQSGKALYVGISLFNAANPDNGSAAARVEVLPLIHQPSYNLLNRWVDKTGLLDTLDANGVGCIAFTPLAQGLLTGKYLNVDPGRFADAERREKGLRTVGKC